MRGQALRSGGAREHVIAAEHQLKQQRLDFLETWHRNLSQISVKNLTRFILNMQRSG